MTQQARNNDPVLTVKQMLAAEQKLFDAGISVDDLMLEVGESCAQMIWRIGAKTPTLILSGPGNNGGDGYVIAEHLRRHGVPVTLAQSGPPGTDAARNACAAYQGKSVALDEARPATQFVDCLFGSGLSRPVDEALWHQFERLFDGASRRFAIDLPSGVDADRAVALNPVKRFDHIFALGAWKFAHLLQPGSDLGAQVSLVDINVRLPEHRINRLARPKIAAPNAASHKYSRGLVVILAGTMPGAAILSATAAQASGAGYVKILSLDAAPYGLPVDVVWEQYPDISALEAALQDPRIATCLIGPGLGRDTQAETLFRAAIECKASLVIDADALRFIADARDTLDTAHHAVILTPHAGEFAHMADALGISKDIDHAVNKAMSAQLMVEKLDTALIFKGNDSVLADPSGAVTIAERNSPWLSVAGSGDVLAGALAARLAATSDPMRAMCEAQYLQKRAADIAGPSFSASQLARCLAPALAACL